MIIKIVKAEAVPGMVQGAAAGGTNGNSFSTPLRDPSVPFFLCCNLWPSKDLKGSQDGAPKRHVLEQRLPPLSPVFESCPKRCEESPIQVRKVLASERPVFQCQPQIIRQILFVFLTARRGGHRHRGDCIDIASEGDPLPQPVA